MTWTPLETIKSSLILTTIRCRHFLQNQRMSLMIFQFQSFSKIRKLHNLRLQTIYQALRAQIKSKGARQTFLAQIFPPS
jgi:hypothetical protein